MRFAPTRTPLVVQTEAAGVKVPTLLRLCFLFVFVLLFKPM
jgi:hypothetical protein